MESIDKLRELAADINGTEIIAHIDLGSRLAFHSEWLDSWHKAFDAACEEIEREIAERYMQLPLDAGGVLVRLGEELVSLDTGERGIVTGLANDSVQCDASALWELASHYHHFKPRTVEDVLREFAQCFCTDKINFDGSADGDTVAKYAAEIRELMGVGA